jgi:peptidoglycan/LPS O-acetylase OafA/YrhL
MLREVHPRAGSRTATTAASVGRFIAGDPLRAIAASGVLLFHLTWAVRVAGSPSGRLDPGTVMQLSEFGRLGLYVFFVLSGYLLGRPFVRAFVERRQSPAIGAYLRNRALRIVPAFWLAVTLTIVAFGAMGSSGRQIGAMYLFAQDAEPSGLSARLLQGWSIGLEVCFYVFLPVAAVLIGAAARRMDRRGRLAVLWSLLAVAFLGSLLLQTWVGGPAGAAGWQRSLPAMLFAFVPGIALAIVEGNAEGRLRTHRRRGVLLARLLLGEAVVAGVLHVAVIFSGPAWLASASAAAAAGGIVAAAIVRQWALGVAWRVLDNAPMRWLGERSYGIYLFHALVIGFVFDRIHGMNSIEAALILVPAVLVITPALAALSYRFVERPLLRLRHRGWRPAAPAATVTLPSAAVPPAAAVPPPAARGA